MMAELLGAPAQQVAGASGSGGDGGGQAGSGAGSGPEVAGAPATPRPAADGAEASPFPLVALLALMAAGLAAFLLRPGLKLAGSRLQERSEHAIDRRQQQLVSAVNGILDERD